MQTQYTHTCPHCGKDYRSRYRDQVYCTHACATGHRPRQIWNTPERFWAMLDYSTEHHLWTGGQNGIGYGQWRYRGRTIVAHRLAWILTHGPIPEGLFVCHRCDTPLCCNPAHLFLGTHDDNMRDKSAKGRQARGEQQGLARLTEDNVRAIRDQRASGVARAAIAAQFSISLATVGQIIRRKTWAHI